MDLATAYVGVQLRDTGIAQQAARAGKTAGDAAGKAIEQGLDTGSKQGAKRAADNITDVAGKIRNAFALGAAVAGLKNVIDAASNLNEEVSKSQVIFGDAAGEIREFAKSADAIGLSEQAALQATGTFAVFGKAAGLAGDDLVDFSQKSATLATDLASFFNTSPEQAIQAIGAAFRGESEPIRAYGVLLNEASLKQEALDQGLITTTTGTLPQAARVQAAYGLIMKQTTDAQGDFARTADGAANKQRILAAEFENARASLGQSLLPVFKDLLSVAQVLIDVFNQLPEPLKLAGIALGAFAALRGPLGGLVGVVKQLGLGFAAANPYIIAAVGIITAATVIFADMGNGIDETTPKYKDFAKAVKDSSKSIENSNDAFIEQALAADDVGAAMTRLGVSSADVAKVVRGNRDDALTYVDSLRQVAGGNDEATAAVDTLATEIANLQWSQYAAAALQFNGAVKSIGVDGIAKAAEAAGASKEQVEGLTAAFANGTTTATALALTGINVAATMDQVRDAMNDASKAAGGANNDFAGLTNANDTMNVSLQATEDAFSGAADAAKALKDALDLLIGTNVDLDKATDKAIEQEQKVAETLKKNGATLDDYTEKGRDNQEAIRNSVEAELSYADALIKSGGSTDDAAQKLNEYRSRLVETMVQTGLTREEAEAYVNQLGLTPEKISTAVELAHLEEEKTRLSNWLTSLEGVPKDKKTEIQALIDQGKIAEAEQELNTLARNRTVTFGVRVVGGEQVDTVGGHVGGTVVSGTRAHGGPVIAGHLYRVNEFGPTRPEFFVPGSDGKVVPLGAALTSTTGRPAVPSLSIANNFYGDINGVDDLERVLDARDRRLAAMLGAM